MPEKEPPKLKIPPKTYTGETTVISARLPKDMIADLDKVAKATGRTRNEILQKQVLRTGMFCVYSQRSRQDKE